MPLVSVVPVLQPLLLAFAALFSKPQRRHFDNSIQNAPGQRRLRRAQTGRLMIASTDQDGRQTPAAIVRVSSPVPDWPMRGERSLDLVKSIDTAREIW